MNYHNVHTMLVGEAAQVGWPTAFEHDLFLHDHRYLEENKPEKFVWVLRDYGTSIIDASWLPTPHTPDPDGCMCWGAHDGAAGWLRATIDTWPEARYYIVDVPSERFELVNPESAVEFVEEVQHVLSCMSR